MPFGQSTILIYTKIMKMTYGYNKLNLKLMTKIGCYFNSQYIYGNVTEYFSFRYICTEVRSTEGKSSFYNTTTFLSVLIYPSHRGYHHPLVGLQHMWNPNTQNIYSQNQTTLYVQQYSVNSCKCLHTQISSTSFMRVEGV